MNSTRAFTLEILEPLQGHFIIEPRSVGEWLAWLPGCAPLQATGENREPRNSGISWICNAQAIISFKFRLLIRHDEFIGQGWPVVFTSTTHENVKDLRVSL